MMNESDDLARGSAFRRLQAVGEGVGGAQGQLGVTNEMMQVISAQNILIMKLLQRQNELYRQLNRKLASSDSGSGNDRPHQPSQDQNIEQLSSSSNPPPPRQHHSTLLVCPQPPRSAPEERFQSGEEEGDEVSDFRGERPRQPETKNMIKNFAKAIFGFISKHHHARARVLAQEGVSETDFMAAVQRCRGKVHSIAELRGLWTRDGTFGRVFRILSCEYLRKHCLQRTFNSRVENYAVHLKYRQRLMEGLRHPQSFTALKTD